jgi:D-alanine-D-alanine ligase
MNVTLNPVIKPENLFIWILAPFIETGDSNIDSYYDFTQSIAEYNPVFKELGIDWKWQNVTVNDYKKIIDGIAATKIEGNVFPVVLNLCDGDEVNGTPGVSVIEYLEEKNLVYTGSDACFYNLTTSKITMKKAFDAAKVSTPKWKAIYKIEDNNDSIFDELGIPIIIKPAISAGSMGVGIKNVIPNKSDLDKQLIKMFEGYRGWHLTSGGIIAESFVAGLEFTVFLVGNYKNKESAYIFPPVERVFHKSLPELEQILSFDRHWKIHEEEPPMPDNAHFYDTIIPDIKFHKAIKDIAWDAFAAVNGTGYARVDIRMEKETGKLYVLEVNSQCSIGTNEDFTSCAVILKFADISFTQLIARILNNNNKGLKIFSIEE